MTSKERTAWLITVIVTFLWLITLFSYFANVMFVSAEQPPMSFEHRWGECTLHLVCHSCLEQNDFLNSSLDLCWEQTDMDRHMEIFGR